MKRLFFICSLAVVLYTCSVNAQQADTLTFPQVTIPGTEVRYIQSSIIGDEFKIFIALPANYRSADTTYPVLYCTDANTGFAVTTQIIRVMQLDNELPQIIIVGIGYRSGDTLSKWSELRSRDLTPTSVPNEVTGGAPKFLRFIREELMPFIKKNYRASGDAAYAGYSHGGLFGLYALFHEPSTFNRYVIGSPSIFYDSLVTLKYEADYAAKHSDLAARVFMSVGELEEKADPLLPPAYKMVTNMQQLADNLLSRRYPSLHLQTVLFPGETHLSGYPCAMSRGFRVIYQK